jgi:transcriptional regulator with XRE-family HTH domain
MTPIDTETFGERLRRLREAKGFALTTLAMKVGLTEACIRQLETGRTKEPRLGDGMRLADALGADVRYLAFGEGDPPPRAPDLAERVAAIERRLGLGGHPPH